MNRWVLSALILSLALNLGFGLAWLGHQRVLASQQERLLAQQERGEHRRGGGGGIPHHLRPRHDGTWAQRRAHRLHLELGLDPERRDALRTSLEPLEPEIIETRLELSRARQGFAEALHVEDPDREEVMLLHHEVSRLQAQLDSLVAEALLKESQILDLGERQRFGPWSPRHGGRPSNEEKRR